MVVWFLSSLLPSLQSVHQLRQTWPSLADMSGCCHRYKASDCSSVGSSPSHFMGLCAQWCPLEVMMGEIAAPWPNVGKICSSQPHKEALKSWLSWQHCCSMLKLNPKAVSKCIRGNGTVSLFVPSWLHLSKWTLRMLAWRKSCCVVNYILQTREISPFCL